MWPLTLLLPYAAGVKFATAAATWITGAAVGPSLTERETVLVNDARSPAEKRLMGIGIQDVPEIETHENLLHSCSDLSALHVFHAGWLISPSYGVRRCSMSIPSSHIYKVQRE